MEEGDFLSLFKVLVIGNIHPVGLDLLKKHNEVKVTTEFKKEHILKEVQDVDAIVIRGMEVTLDQEIINNAPKLRVIGRHGIGLETIDLDAAKEHNIQVVYTPLASCESVAEHVIGFMINLSKKMRLADIAARQNDWQARYQYIGSELFQKTIGILGMGRIGRRISEICKLAFHMNVLYFDQFNYPEYEKKFACKRDTLENILKQSDYISINLPYRPELYHFIGEEHLNMMKKNAFIINTARGPIWDEQALISVLKSHRIAGMATDVFEKEPFEKGRNIFADFDNVILSPHLAAHTDEALIKMSLVSKDVMAVLEGRKPDFLIPI